MDKKKKIESTIPCIFQFWAPTTIICYITSRVDYTDSYLHIVRMPNSKRYIFWGGLDNLYYMKDIQMLKGSSISVFNNPLQGNYVKKKVDFFRLTATTTIKILFLLASFETFLSVWYNSHSYSHVT